jgi:hypothetical protein
MLNLCWGDVEFFSINKGDYLAILEQSVHERILA